MLWTFFWLWQQHLWMHSRRRWWWLWIRKTMVIFFFILQSKFVVDVSIHRWTSFTSSSTWFRTSSQHQWLFVIKCSMIMFTKIKIFRPVSFTSTNSRSEWYWYTAQSRIYICYRCVKQQQQTCSITMAMHNYVTKATSLGSITKYAWKVSKIISTFFWFLFDVCITNAYILSQSTVTNQYLNHWNLHAETCDSAYWHLQVMEAYWKAN